MCTEQLVTTHCHTSLKLHMCAADDKPSTYLDWPVFCEDFFFRFVSLFSRGVAGHTTPTFCTRDLSSLPIVFVFFFALN